MRTGGCPSIAITRRISPPALLPHQRLAQTDLPRDLHVAGVCRVAG
jgi:hypothetical protein